MSAEQLIGLEAAQAELGTLYAVARSFTALHARAEVQLLPHLTALGSRLRGLLRQARLTDDEVDLAAREIVSVRTSGRQSWSRCASRPSISARSLHSPRIGRRRSRSSSPRSSPGCTVVRSAPSLYFPVSPSSGRRRPGTSPFLSTAECADRILRIVAEGYEPESDGTEWWERELPSISCAESVAALETPIALCLAASDVRVAVFTTYATTRVCGSSRRGCAHRCRSCSPPRRLTNGGRRIRIPTANFAMPCAAISPRADTRRPSSAPRRAPSTLAPQTTTAACATRRRPLSRSHPSSELIGQLDAGLGRAGGYGHQLPTDRRWGSHCRTA